MIKYKIFITEDADRDIESVFRYISSELFMPQAAQNYRKGLYKKIKSLSSCAGSFRPETRLSIINRYGLNVRRINYKKMAVLYLVHDTEVYVLRVVHGSAISGIF